MTTALQTHTANRVRAAISRVTGYRTETLVPECSLVEDLGADELDLVEIAIELEEEFWCFIEQEEMHQAGTVSDLVKLIEAKVGAMANV